VRPNVPHDIEECLKEIRSLKRDLYGDPQIRQKGVFDRLEALEERLADLRSQYERERMEQGYYDRIETDIGQLQIDYRIALVYLKGIAGAVGAITVAFFAAVVVGVVRYLVGA
jgi:hypothetical protein